MSVDPGLFVKTLKSRLFVKSLVCNPDVKILQVFNICRNARHERGGVHQVSGSNIPCMRGASCNVEPTLNPCHVVNYFIFQMSSKNNNVQCNMF